jgi:hypothetical protein
MDNLLHIWKSGQYAFLARKARGGELQALAIDSRHTLRLLS